MTLTHDEQFLRLVRQHLEPVLLDAGFVFNEVAVGAWPVTAPLVRESGVGAALSTAASPQWWQGFGEGHDHDQRAL